MDVYHAYKDADADANVIIDDVVKGVLDDLGYDVIDDVACDVVNAGGYPGTNSFSCFQIVLMCLRWSLLYSW